MTSRVRLARRLAPILAAGAMATALPGAEPVSPPVVEYTIQASLDAAAHAVDGQERLVWRNPPREAGGELRVHPYPESVKNKPSPFFPESGWQLRRARFRGKP